MANFYKDNEDLQFYVDHGIDWTPLVELTERGFHSEDGWKSVDEALQFYRDVLEMVGEFTAEEVAPIAATLDHAGLTLEGGEVVEPPEHKALFDKIKDLELHGLPAPRELGGMNAPMLLYMLNSEMFARADVSVMSHHGFHGGIAMAMLLYSMHEGTTKVDPKTGLITETRFKDAVEEILRGEAWGCMDITEPDAGSDMGAIRAKGEQDDRGDWFVTGPKIFITSGHGKYHFVIARTEKSKGDGAFDGLEGLSLFLVKTYEDTPEGRVRYATVSRLEEKLGHHGSVTATIDFDESPAWLIGKRGEGFKLMLMLMNNARVGVGFESLGLCEAAHRLASAYAAERRSMGKTIDRHEMIADYLDEMHTGIQGIRAMAVVAAYCEEMAQKCELAAKLGLYGMDAVSKKRYERDARRYKRRARYLTPLLKYHAAEAAVRYTRLGIQIHGGVGYTVEFGAERLLRDALVMPIYEGTSQIQALMAMKDSLASVFKNPQAFVKRMAQARWRSVSARDGLERRVARMQALAYSAQQHLISKTAVAKLRSLTGQPIAEWGHALKGWDPKRDFAHAMLHAERLTQLLADTAICEILHDQAKVHPDRKDVLERYLDRCEPRARFLHDEITTTGDRLIERLSGSAEPEADAAAK